ncbi:predicted protein [Streptomyces sp. AA4]|nr:predicted protein [Streptomyces sp. AA4]
MRELNARYPRAIRARGHFLPEQTAKKRLYLVTRSLDPTGTGRARWTMRWKSVINAFAITFGDRWPEPNAADRTAGNTDHGTDPASTGKASSRAASSGPGGFGWLCASVYSSLFAPRPLLSPPLVRCK